MRETFPCTPCLELMFSQDNSEIQCVHVAGSPQSRIRFGNFTHEDLDNSSKTAQGLFKGSCAGLLRCYQQLKKCSGALSTRMWRQFRELPEIYPHFRAEALNGPASQARATGHRFAPYTHSEESRTFAATNRAHNNRHVDNYESRAEPSVRSFVGQVGPFPKVIKRVVMPDTPIQLDETNWRDLDWLIRNRYIGWMFNELDRNHTNIKIALVGYGEGPSASYKYLTNKVQYVHFPSTTAQIAYEIPVPADYNGPTVYDVFRMLKRRVPAFWTKGKPTPKPTETQLEAFNATGQFTAAAVVDGTTTPIGEAELAEEDKLQNQVFEVTEQMSVDDEETKEKTDGDWEEGEDDGFGFD